MKYFERIWCVCQPNFRIPRKCEAAHLRLVENVFKPSVRMTGISGHMHAANDMHTRASNWIHLYRKANDAEQRMPRWKLWKYHPTPATFLLLFTSYKNIQGASKCHSNNFFGEGIPKLSWIEESSTWWSCFPNHPLTFPKILRLETKTWRLFM